jgi:uncharacterized damage-inducible protein DinB
MSVVQFQKLYAHHWHTIQKLLACSARLDSKDYFEHPGVGHGSIHALLFHLLRTDQSWWATLDSGKQQPPLLPENYPDLASLTAGFAQVQSKWTALLAGFDDARTESDAHLTTWRGEEAVMPYWRALQHVALHGMQHFAEIGLLLTQKGQSPGDIDFIFYD